MKTTTFNKLKLKDNQIAIVKQGDAIISIGNVNHNGGQCDCCSIDKESKIEVIKIVTLDEVIQN